MLYAQQCAVDAGAPLAVCFSLVEEFLGAGPPRTPSERERARGREGARERWGGGGDEEDRLVCGGERCC